MMQFKAYGYTLDLPEGTSVQLTRKNEIFAFDDIECERSVGFDLPATPTNEKVMQLAGNYHGDGVQMRVRIDAQMIVGVVTYNGYLYVQQYDLTKQAYKAVFVFGQLLGLRALKEAGKFGELGLQTDLYITDDSIIYSAPDALTRAWARVQYATYNPHGSVSVKLLFDMLAAQTDLPPVTLPADAEGLRVIKGKNNGFDYEMQMASDVNPDAGYQPDTTLPENPYNLCTHNADLFETCEDSFGIYRTMGGQSSQQFWNIQGIKAKAPLRLTFPQEIGGAWFARKNGWQSGASAFWGDYWYEPVLNDNPQIHGKSLAGKTIELQQGDELYLVNVGDFVYKQISGDIINGWLFENNKQTFPYDFAVKIAGESRYYLRDNMPDMTPLELCKIVAAVTGKVLRYSDASGVYFDDLTTWTMMDLQDVTKRKTMDRTFNGYARHNIIRFDDEDNEEAQELDYTIDNATIDEVKELQEIKMSQGKQGVYLSQPAIALVGENDTIARTVTDTEFGGKNYLQRVELTKIAAIQDFCDTSTSLQLEAMMNILQYKQITPTTLLRYDGAQWAWSELQWNRERVQMKLAMQGAIGEVAFNWLTYEAREVIVGAFGYIDGGQVINAANEYLDNIAIVDINKATVLAGYINEDPMMVCNIVETPKVRWVGSDGLAWVISNLKLQANDIVEVVGGFDVPDTARTGSMALFGMNVGPTTQSWANPNQIGMNDYHPDSSQDYSRFIIGPHAATLTIEFPRRKLAKVVVDFGQKKKWVNGVQSTVAANFSGINMATLFANDCLPFYASNTNGTINTGAATSGRMLSYFKVTRSGAVVFHGIPLVGQTKQGMIDAVSGAYFPNQGTGSFTEHIETPTP